MHRMKKRTQKERKKDEWLSNEIGKKVYVFLCLIQKKDKLFKWQLID